MQRYWPLLWDTRCKSSMVEQDQIHFLLFSIPILFSQMILFLIAVLFHNANCLAQSILVHVAGQVLYSLLLTCQCICWGKWKRKWKWGWIIHGVEVAGTGPRLCDFLAKKIQEIHVISMGPRLCDFLAKNTRNISIGPRLSDFCAKNTRNTSIGPRLYNFLVKKYKEIQELKMSLAQGTQTMLMLNPDTLSYSDWLTHNSSGFFGVNKSSLLHTCFFFQCSGQMAQLTHPVWYSIMKAKL